MSYKSEGSLIQESGNNVRGLRSIRFDLGFHPGKHGVIRFPNNWDLKADLQAIDRIEFFLAHKNLTNIGTIEFRAKTGGNSYYKVNLDMQTTNWIKHFFSPTDFTTVGSPDWSNINCIEFYFPHSGGISDFFDDFDDGDLSGWVLGQEIGEIVASSKHSVSGAYSMRLIDDSTGVNDYVTASRTWTELTSGTIYIDFSIYVSFFSGESACSIWIGDSSNVKYARVECMRNGTVWVETGDASPYKDSDYGWNIGQWIHFRIKIDLSGSTWDLYVDDFTTPVLTGLSFIGSPSGVGKILFGSVSNIIGPTGHTMTTFYVDDVSIGRNPISGILQIDGLVFRKKEVYAIAENVESQKIWGVRELPLIDKETIEKETAQELVRTFLRNYQYPTFRVKGTIPLLQENLLGKNVYVTPKGMKLLVPINNFRVTIEGDQQTMNLEMGAEKVSPERILESFGIEQSRISVGGAGIDFGAILEQFEKACFQTCETTCQECKYGGTCESSCQKTGCLTECQISLCETNCQGIKDRYENWCSEGIGCQTCVEGGPIV